MKKQFLSTIASAVVCLALIGCAADCIRHYTAQPGSHIGYIGEDGRQHIVTVPESGEVDLPCGARQIQHCE